LWLGRLDGPAHGYDRALAIAASPVRAEVFVTGQIDLDDPFEGNWATVAYRT